MNYEMWNKISIIFLIIGILFLIITIVLSVKFQLISIIKAEIQNKKDAGKEEYFTYAENRNRLNNTVEQFSQEELDVESRFESFSPQSVQENIPSATIPSSRSRNQNIQNDSVFSKTESSATVVKSRNRSSSDTVVRSSKMSPLEKSAKDFLIIEEILVIHGDPARIQGNNA